MLVLFKFILLLAFASGLIWAIVNIPNAWNYFLDKLTDCAEWIDNLRTTKR